ncbi:Replication factor A, C-terminal [Dillenia turbinata]|uniref:Replication factor A, C-terminal n=1 Tax=Dillenia turbinata TaxID=194707 RepID=A0AAN8UCN3_9MAGN
MSVACTIGQMTIEIQSSIDGDVEGEAGASDNSDDELGLDCSDTASPRCVNFDGENQMDCSNVAFLRDVNCEGENMVDHSNISSVRVMDLVRDKGDVVPKSKSITSVVGQDTVVVKGKGKEKGTVSDVAKCVGHGNAKSKEKGAASKAAALTEFQRLRKDKTMHHVNTMLERQIQLRVVDVERLEKALGKKEKLLDLIQEDLDSSYVIIDLAKTECEKLDALLRKKTDAKTEMGGRFYPWGWSRRIVFGGSTGGGDNLEMDSRFLHCSSANLGKEIIDASVRVVALREAAYHYEYTCNFCNEKQLAEPRYRFEVNLSDESGVITATLFGEMAEQILGLTVAEAMKTPSKIDTKKVANLHVRTSLTEKFKLEDVATSDDDNEERNPKRRKA